jgi:hypothetical protein
MRRGIPCLSLGLVAALAFGCKREQRVFDPGSSGTQVAMAFRSPMFTRVARFRHRA